MADIEAAKKDEATSAYAADGPRDPVDDLKREHENRHVGTLERRLKSRHVQFLALSGAIGTGLFVGSGQMLSLAGPLSTVLA